MFWYGNREVLRMFRAGNVIVAGHKGRGKDLMFQYVIKARDKAGEIHAANIRYLPSTKVREIKHYELHNNSFKNFITGKFATGEIKQLVEKEDYYISDVGTALPAQYGNQLQKEYPTFPIVYALSRHLADFNIHCNVQNFNRVWDKLREQADYYIYMEKAKVFFGKIACMRFIVYDRYQSALANIQPYKCRRRLLGLLRPQVEDYARANEHNAKYGTIRRYFMWYILPKEHYDTRAFHKKIYGTDPPKIEKKKKRSDKNKVKQK